MVIITKPGTEYPLPTLTVEWLYTDAEEHPQAYQVVTLYKDDIQLERRARSAVVTHNGTGSEAFNTVLSDGETYKVTVAVRDSSGLWGEVKEVVFDVVYIAPPIPEITLSYVKTEGKMLVTIINPDSGGGEAEASYNRIYRRINDGDPVLIADGVSLNTTFMDYIPIIGGVNYYFAVAVADLGAGIISAQQSFEESLEVNDPGYYFLNSGPAWSDWAAFIADPTVEIKFGKDQVMRQFAGRERPVLFQGTALTTEISFSAFTLKSDKVKRLIENTGAVFYRDYTGRRFPAAIEEPRLTKVENDTELYRFTGRIIRVEEAE